MTRHGAKSPNTAGELAWVAVFLASALSIRKKPCHPVGAIEDAQETVRLLESKTCTQCGTLGKMKSCAGCDEAAFCDRACQRAHWKAHKAVCAAVKK